MEIDKIWCIIPAHNESINIGDTIKKSKKYVNNVVVVDDGSRDDTYKIAKSNNVMVLKHVINLGKGAALKTGCDYAVKEGAENIVVLDADAQHDPNEIPHFLEKLEDYDIVFGYRKGNKKMPAIMRFGNWFISKVIGFLYSIDLKDTQSGFRAFTSETYKKIRWNATDYSMESEMIVNAGRHELNYTEVPIRTIYSDKYKGTTIIDGVKIVINMFWFKFFNGG
tara:strand:- start:509 stop:1177 length:669 start_codon:yes stop_codon:yes gene_type:complete